MKTASPKSRRIFYLSAWCLAAAFFLVPPPCATAQTKTNFFVTNGINFDWCTVTIGFTDGSSEERKIFKNRTGQWLNTGKCLQSIKGTCGSLGGTGTRPKELIGQDICASASYHIKRLFTNFHYEIQFVKK